MSAPSCLGGWGDSEAALAQGTAAAAGPQLPARRAGKLQGLRPRAGWGCATGSFIVPPTTLHRPCVVPDSFLSHASPHRAAGRRGSGSAAECATKGPSPKLGPAGQWVLKGWAGRCEAAGGAGAEWGQCPALGLPLQWHFSRLASRCPRSRQVRPFSGGGD